MQAVRGGSVPTARVMVALAPERGVVEVDGLQVLVRVLDARTVWGRVQYLVTPVAGSGQRWVDAARVMAEGDGE